MPKYYKQPRKALRDYVYIIRTGKAIKIGISHYPLTRFDGITKENGTTTPIQLLACVSVLSAPYIERLFHQAFSAQRIHGEYFTLTEDQTLDAIETLHLLAQNPPNVASLIRAKLTVKNITDLREILPH